VDDDKWSDAAATMIHDKEKNENNQPQIARWQQNL
jgi:hypothetical protein